MILIVCADDRLGMAFNGRRQSRDRAVYADIAELTAGAPVHMALRSAKLFDGTDVNVAAAERFADETGEDEYCFVEFQSPAPLEERTKKIVLYRWNRHYPADLYFDIPLEEWRQTERFEFAGTSHEIITREVYVREGE